MKWLAASRAVLCLAGLWCPSLAWADDEASEAPVEQSETGATGHERHGEDLRWIPSLAVAVDLQMETDDANVTSFFESGGAIRPPASGTRDFLSGIPRFDGELLTPAAPWAGSPRLLAHAGWQWGWLAFKEDRAVAKEGNPGNLDVPPIPPPPGTVTGPAGTVNGQGSVLNLEIKDAWYAGLGAAFLVPVAGIQLRLKPSIDYYREYTSLSGEMHNVGCRPFGANDARCVRRLPPTGVDTLVTQSVSAAQDETFDALGPRLGVEYDLLEARGFAMSLFADGYTYWILGDRKVEFSGQSPCKPAFNLPDTTCVADFSFRKDPIVSGASVGVRVSWRGLEIR